jgi:hypothetical protein
MSNNEKARRLSSPPAEEEEEVKCESFTLLVGCDECGGEEGWGEGRSLRERSKYERCWRSARDIEWSER